MKQLLVCICALALFSNAVAQTVNVESFASGFDNPVNIQNAGDDRLFVVEQNGIIKILTPDGTTNTTPFLDISSRVSCCGERGLLGLAFHPDYATNGFFYINYTDTGGDTQVSRFSVDPADPNIALSGSELPILDYEQPFGNHNGGCLAFGPDGFLYISSGDGGSGGDPGNRAQNTELLLGKLLRLDVDNPSGGNNYGIPADNPFAGDLPNRPEIWAYGLRNPWKFSFDSVTDDLWIGDVGQGDVEEIDRAEIDEAGLNYGWKCYEGSVPFPGAPTSCPPVSDLTFPIAEYSSSTGSGNCSITGGNVYRGSRYPNLVGLYFFADVCSGLIGTVDQAGTLTEHGTFNGSWVSFGEDTTGQLYIVNRQEEPNGTIHKIVGDVLGTNDFELPNTLLVYPNPTENSVHLELQTGTITQYAVMDMKGSVVIHNKGLDTTQTTINVANLVNGIYILKITTETNRTIIKKLLVN
ncbi:PQQ-dependent sugar dehydrogenase [Rasiella sp. SM2506]|uniref:PQQ-dependent sugar dehydrogenase n=1 Tax=Rasiella sp. SM2506 TaxID=3423914 RepID=UPI003D78C840